MKKCNINNIEPKKVFKYFQEICKIPHGSGNTEKISEYCISFAEERGLKAIKDSGGNVVIYKPGTLGYEDSKPVILQAHFDMVCEKTEDCKIDMAKEGIILQNDDEYIWADGTTLGADDGIAMAYILALLDSHTIPHPPIEALLTRDEEIGMLGANALDVKNLTGKRLINIDSEAEGILTVSCAGGVRAYCQLPLNFIPASEGEVAFELELSGLKGGHSGVDIILQRKNAHIVMGRLLQHIARNVDFSIAAMNGGKKTNVIPTHIKAVICTSEKNAAKLKRVVAQFDEIIKEELTVSEPDVKVSIDNIDMPAEHTDKESTEKIIFTLQQIPDGIQAMSPDIPSMVQTSLNMGELEISNHMLKMGYLIRSNASTGKQLTIQKLNSFIDYLKGKIYFASDYPVWEYRADSPLREIMIDAYEKVYADKPKLESIHAGLECGILSGKMPYLDMVSFGPDLENVHTPQERMSISSVARCWTYLLKVLEMLK
jgi:dipeptidase D